MATNEERTINLLAHIVSQLDTLIKVSAATQSPNYRRSLAEYPSFNWGEIGATIVESEAHLATEVEWHGHRFLRRSGSGKFGDAVWFSRSVGGAGDDAEYARLITFKNYDVEPLKINPSQAQPVRDPRDISPINSQDPAMDRRVARADQRQAERQMDKMDIQETRQAARPAIAQPIKGNAKQEFYQIAKPAFDRGVISHQKFNEMVRRGGREGWPLALEQIREVLEVAA